ncbi:MAG: site-2 protease family protein [Candidatus Melainabacteria bacterium]|nr:MAG: site-2 protease family protein [Candidatus Melainabacteria bacterium]
MDKFGIGLPIGPTLYEKQIGDTKFLIHAFLLGGYVSFPDDDENCKLPKWSPLRFENKPIYQRAIVIASGVIANVLAAYLLVFLTATMWGKLPLNNYDIYVSKILPNVNQQLQTTNLKPKDKIIKINGANLEYPSDINLYATLSKNMITKQILNL